MSPGRRGRGDRQVEKRCRHEGKEQKCLTSLKSVLQRINGTTEQARECNLEKKNTLGKETAQLTQFRAYQNISHFHPNSNNHKAIIRHWLSLL